MGGTCSKELELAKKLKSLCDDDGKETNPIKSSEIFYQFGLVYRSKSPDKISLIQSAVFFNAAIVRQPKNMRFQKALGELCNHILYESPNKRKAEVDLINIANIAALKVKEMRIHTKHVLKKLKKIPSDCSDSHKTNLEIQKVRVVRKLQNDISNKYMSIMKYVSGKSEETMGKPPCRYSVTGMGSLARKEITPYSDFEHVIVLEEGVQHREDYENNILEYFRWFTVVFNIIIINLQESIIRSVAVPLLNDDSIPGGDWFFDAHTTCGIKFDGMQLPACKFPLGRTRETDSKPFTIELIKPVSEMAKFLETDEDIKNGYHLADVLTKTCFVSGSREIHVCFANAAKTFLANNRQSRMIQYFWQVNEHMSEFDIVKSIMGLQTIGYITYNIKCIIYRSTTLFISIWGRLLNLNEHSCFDIIERLFKASLITIDTASKLMYAISVACEIRLKVYMNKKNQDDFLGGRGYKATDNKAFDELAFYVGEQSLLDCFEIMCSFQQAMKVCNQLPDLPTLCLKWKPLIRFGMLSALGQNKIFFSEWKKYEESDQKEPPDDDLHIRFITVLTLLKIGHAAEALMILDQVDGQTITQEDTTFLVFMRTIKLECLCILQHYEDAVKYIEKTKKKLNNFKVRNEYHNFAMFVIARIDVDCKLNLHLYEEARLSTMEALAYVDVLETDKDRNSSKALCFNLLGQCYSNIGEINQSLASFTLSLILYYKSSVGFQFICDCYSSLGQCYGHRFQFNNALKCFQTELTLRLQNLPSYLHNQDKDILLCRGRIQKLNVLRLKNFFSIAHHD